MRDKLTKIAFRVSMVYLLAAGVWIFFSNWVEQSLTSDSKVWVDISIYKWWAFLVATTVLLFVALRRQLRRSQDESDSRKAAEKFSAGIQGRLRAIFDFAPVGIFTLSTERKFISCNRAFERIAGYSENELNDLTINDIAHSDDTDINAALFWNTAEGSLRNGSCEKRFVRKDGSVIWAYLEFSGAYDDKGQSLFIVGVAVNITERRESEGSVQRLNSMYAVLSNINEMFTRVQDRQKLLDEVCRIAVEMGKFKFAWIGLADERSGEIKQRARFGVEDGYLDSLRFSLSYAGSNLDKVLTTVLGEGRHVIRNDIGEAAMECTFTAEAVARGFKSFAVFPLKRLAHTYGMIAFYSTEAGFFGEREESILKELSSDVAYTIDYVEREDIRRSLEAQNSLSQKLESLGILAGGVAHDFNNILGIIIGYASTIDVAKFRSENLKKAVEAILKAGARGAEVVKQLLTIARKKDSELGPVHIDDIAIRVKELLKETLPKTIDVLMNLEPELPLLIGDSAQLHQALLNLCLNAGDAMPAGGCLEIVIGTSRPESVVSKFPSAPLRNYIVIKVNDTGAGIDEETKKRIFDPFFTTKGIGKGAGLGLSLVHSIVMNHHGFIDVETQVGKGSKFTIFLPIWGRDISGHPFSESSIQESSGAGGETILLIEDEEMLRDLMKTVIESNGYNVLVAGDGKQALDTFASHRDDISVVISDLGLPKISGYEVLEKIHSFSPGARLIAASGFMDSESISRLAKLGVKHIVPKPYIPMQVLETIRTALGVVA